MKATKKMPSQKALKEAIAGLAGKALFDGAERQVYVRVAGFDDRVFIDLGPQIVVITADGWLLRGFVDEVRFLRPRGFLPLPAPVKTDRPLTSLIQNVVNVSNVADAKLLTAWVVGAARGRKPFPILNLTGEQGSGKSSASRNLRRMIDPNVADSRVTPREMRDLMIAARNGYVAFFDNLTHLDEWLMNGLCCLATGAGSATRELTTDTNEVIINAARPIILNGINDVVTRSDLLDRAIVVALDPISEERRLTEAEADATFEHLRPAILGAICDAVACALKYEATTRPERLPRMADFATTIVAASSALGWLPHEFLDAYSANRDDASSALLDSNIVASAVRELVIDRQVWSGSAGAMLAAMTTEERRENKYWPRSARHLAGKLREVAPGLRGIGIDVVFDRTAEGRVISVTNPKAQAPKVQEVRSNDSIPF